MCDVSRSDGSWSAWITFRAFIEFSSYWISVQLFGYNEINELVIEALRPFRRFCMVLMVISRFRPGIGSVSLLSFSW